MEDAQTRSHVPAHGRRRGSAGRVTPQYFPTAGTGLLSFLSPHEPPKPHALSETGCLARFLSPDAVEACGGPQAYAALLADALLRDEEQPFIEAFEGPLPATDERRRRQANRPPAEPGGHAERVMAEEEERKGAPGQRMLF